MRKLILILGITGLTGCAQQMALQQKQEAEAAAAYAKAICEKARENPALDPIRNQVAFDASKATVAQLADARKATAPQRAVIAHIDEYNKPCEDASMAYFSDYAPAAVPLHAELNQNLKLTWAKLLTGESTFGQFNSERAKLTTEARTKLTELVAATEAQAQQLQMQQQQLGIQNMQLWNSMQPRTANCYRVGNSISCTQW